MLQPDPRPGKSLYLSLPPPHPALRFCVVVPVKDEAAILPRMLAALQEQVDEEGRPWPPESHEVILLLNNCTDDTAEVARQWSLQHPRLCLHLAEITLPPEEAHVGRARQILFDEAARRLAGLGNPGGLIVSTDADTQPARDWLAQASRAIAAGADAVGGRIVLDPAERAALPAGVQEYFLLDIGYRRALEEMRSLLAPEPHDPFPRHHQHFGASLAVTAEAYLASGGMPAWPNNEDVGLYRALRAVGARIRHSPHMRAQTSARFIGRASGGLADALNWWERQCRQQTRVLVESAPAAERRLRSLGQWAQAHPGEAVPWSLLATPEPPLLEEAEPIRQVLAELRQRNACLRHESLAVRYSPPQSSPIPTTWTEPATI